LRPAFYAVIDGIVSPRAGVVGTLSTLQEAGYVLGLISNTYWAADLHDRHLAQHGLLDFFPVRVYSCEAPVVKPHPAIFLHALGAMGVRPEASAYVGDRPDVDVQGAQEAGMRGILIRSPYMAGDLKGITPDAIVDELPDLIPELETLESAP
jgi:putative hydrolase of the HAD superfamily